ncbi:MAG: nucleotide sugar dehydrogenase [Candidatus Korarchaeum sp.]
MPVMNLSPSQLRRNLRSGKITVAVYGIGHVGAPILAAWVLAGARGIGVDKDEEKVAALERGESPVNEPCLTEVFKKARIEGRISATMDGRLASMESDVKIIAVPSLLSEDGEPDLSAIISVAESIALGLKRGDLVILESSVPPGTTRFLLKPLLEEKSGLSAGRDFGLAYSPERVSEGRALRDILESYPKIVGGIDEGSAKVTSILYSAIARRGVIKVSSELVAEFEKLAEGVYRDVNIALANELATLCRELGIDYEEVVKAANSQPYSNLHRAGTGVGGLCIPIYPKFLIWKAKSLGMSLELTSISRKINEGMPGKVAELVREGISRMGLSDPKIAVLGLSFRGDIGDPRLSPTYELIRELLSTNFRNIVVHDPFIERDATLSSLGIPLIKDLEQVISGASVVVISTDHSLYRMSVSELLSMSNEVKLIVDGRDILEIDDIPDGVSYVGIGRPWRF